jgi:hypothetical protein
LICNKYKIQPKKSSRYWARGKKADHVRDWKDVKSYQQRTRFTVGYKPALHLESAKSERKRRLSNELHGKNKQTPRNKPTQLTDHAFSYTNGVVRFLTWNKYKVRTKESTREWRRRGGGEKHT